MGSPLKDLPEVCILLGADDEIVALNRAAEKALKVSSVEASGKTLAELCAERSVRLMPAGCDESPLLARNRLSGFGQIQLRSLQDEGGNFLAKAVIFSGFTPTAEQEALRKKNEMLVALQETTFDLHYSLDLKVVLHNIVSRAGKLAGTPHGYLAVLQETGAMEPMVGVGALEEMLNFKISPGVGLAGTVWRTGKPLFVPDYDGWANRIGDFPQERIRSVLGLPLVLEGQVIGVISLARGRESEASFSEEDISVLGRFADLAVLALQNARLFQQARAEIAFRRKTEIELRNANQVLQFQLESIEKLQKLLQEQAVRDSLTGLFNRRYLRETLEVEFARVERAESSLAILMLDCDNLKYINDVYGHRAGDEALLHIANVIRESTRAGDIACRYGGDEFVVVLGNVTEETAFERADDLRNRIALGSLVHKDKKVIVNISVGIAMFPAHGTHGEALLHKADQALYSAKHRGKNQVVGYNEQLE